MGGRQQQAVAEIVEELENVRAAWQWNVRTLRVEPLTRSLRAFHLFLVMQGRLQELQIVFEELLTRLRNQRGSAETATLLGVTLSRGAWLAYVHSRFDKTQRLLDESRALLDASDYWFEWGFLLQMEGNLAWQRGDLDKAQRRFKEALELFKRHACRSGIASSLDGLGIVAAERRDHRQAKAYFQEEMEVCEELGDIWGMAARMTNLGLSCEALGEYDQAKRHHRRGIALCREIGYQWEMANNLINLGFVHYALDEDEEAEDVFREALEIALDAQVLAVALEALVGLAALYQRRGLQERASALLIRTLHHPAIYWDLSAVGEDILEELDVRLLTHNFEYPNIREQIQAELRLIQNQT